MSVKFKSLREIYLRTSDEIMKVRKELKKMKEQEKLYEKYRTEYLERYNFLKSKYISMRSFLTRIDNEIQEGRLKNFL